MNYEGFLRELEVKFWKRKAAAFFTQTLKVSKDDEVWTFRYSTKFQTTELKFQAGMGFEETTPDGRKVTTTTTWGENNKFISIQTAKKEDEKSTKVIIEFNDSCIIQTTEIIGSDVVLVQNFKKQ